MSDPQDAKNNPIRITVTDAPGGRRLASSGSKWEPVMGYSRAVRVGNLIAVTGTVGINADGTYSPSLADQTRRSLAIIRAGVESLGGLERPNGLLDLAADFLACEHLLVLPPVFGIERHELDKPHLHAASAGEVR